MQVEYWLHVTFWTVSRNDLRLWSRSHVKEPHIRLRDFPWRVRSRSNTWGTPTYSPWWSVSAISIEGQIRTVNLPVGDSKTATLPSSRHVYRDCMNWSWISYGEYGWWNFSAADSSMPRAFLSLISAYNWRLFFRSRLTEMLAMDVAGRENVKDKRWKTKTMHLYTYT